MDAEIRKPQTVLGVTCLAKTFYLHKREVWIQAFRDVSFHVGSGAITALAGLSGSGKSSILKCVYRTYRPSAGAIYYRTRAGENINLAQAADRDVLAIRRLEFGFVTQYLDCLPRQTALAVAAKPLLDRGVTREAAEAEAGGLFQLLRLPERLWRIPPATMSGGEKQKVNLVRGVLAGSRLLLLDEPAASLDPASAELVFDLILARRAAGVAILAVLHGKRELKQLADFQVRLAPPAGSKTLAVL